MGQFHREMEENRSRRGGSLWQVSGVDQRTARSLQCTPCTYPACHDQRRRDKERGGEGETKGLLGAPQISKRPKHKPRAASVQYVPLAAPPFRPIALDPPPPPFAAFSWKGHKARPELSWWTLSTTRPIWRGEIGGGSKWGWERVDSGVAQWRKEREKAREEERGETGKSPSTLEKRSFTVVDATVIRNGILRCYSFTTTVAIASSLLLVHAFSSLQPGRRSVTIRFAKCLSFANNKGACIKSQGMHFHARSLRVRHFKRTLNKTGSTSWKMNRASCMIQRHLLFFNHIHKSYK